jgi:hypothetical protein
MEQVEIIDKVIENFGSKLEQLDNGGKPSLNVLINENEVKTSKSDAIDIHLVMLGIEENFSQNMCNRLQLEEVDENGDTIEFYVEPPTLIDIKFAVIPYCSSRVESGKILGNIIRLIKDDSFIDINGFDWHGNNSRPAQINNTPGMDLDKQIQVFNLLKMEYTPSLFYQVTVGINSDKKEIFRRVEQRKFDTVKKNEKG